MRQGIGGGRLHRSTTALVVLFGMLFLQSISAQETVNYAGLSGPFRFDAAQAWAGATGQVYGLVAGEVVK